MISWQVRPHGAGAVPDAPLLLEIVVVFSHCHLFLHGRKDGIHYACCYLRRGAGGAIAG